MYVKITNGNVDTWPYSVGQLRRDNPNTSFPKRVSEEMLAEWGVYPVLQDSKPIWDHKTQNLVSADAPTQVNGNWILEWSVVDKTEEEVQKLNEGQAFTNRSERDRRIAETDWWASSDLTMTAEQTTYRQALRDITTHANWPHLEESDWPTKP